MVDQRGRLRELASRYPTIELLHGAELNIDPDGNVDYDAEFLSGFDFAVASVHSHFDLPTERQTIRLLTAMGNSAVRVIGHLSGRMIGRRPGIEFDVDAILEGAETTGVALEINSHLERLDATSEVIRKARGRTVSFIIATDAHRVRELDYMRWGIQQAQRGWLDPNQCVNTWPRKRFLQFCTKEA
jgi:DNA polymerase (family 10)